MRARFGSAQQALPAAGQIFGVPPASPAETAAPVPAPPLAATEVPATPAPVTPPAAGERVRPRTHEEVVEAIRTALAAGPLTVRDVRERTGLIPTTVRSALESLLVQGLVARDGVGGFQDLYHYRLVEQG